MAALELGTRFLGGLGLWTEVPAGVARQLGKGLDQAQRHAGRTALVARAPDLPVQKALDHAPRKRRPPEREGEPGKAVERDLRAPRGGDPRPARGPGGEP